ncbi:2-isopropylmalate synthase [Sinanaerobacter chloroacetimidivorans]|jgi:2-isopropylmalate synthase|uniref:2-isopropylmalate synthase n=1 Tax=Sinanaerobacter chloroacetimidivorans TaxID=2818044 RepID=A0A8J8B1P4_9FIRM|nr:2-isopropylmalate synthase [Sinanaerobacter chloroacetimidivorans]MBR0597881.1 2-isopropylmalate synthase [Sinanaerobacter chloroacetimidivorans]
MTRMIRIFDTTLRDGEQSPGCSMNLKEKIEMAKQLEKMKVDIIEAGFAITSPGDFESVQTISSIIKDCTVASLSRAAEKDIDASWEALKKAVDPRIHIVIATSPIHMQYKLNLEPDAVIEKAVASVKYAKKYCSNIEFSAEDATRSDLEFMARIFDATIQAGATTVNIPDTVGYTTPEEHYEFFMKLRELCPRLDDVTISAHCHNDLGLGVANSLAAIRAGVNQIECTINGIGERAGNAAMEEVVMALHTRKDLFQAETRVVTTELMRASKLLTRITGVKVQPNKAIVGENAFSHESGIHQDGVLKHKQTYEIMTPESIGIVGNNNIVLGKHSGRHAFRNKIRELGYEISDEQLEQAFAKFKVVADKKKSVYDRDIEAILAKETLQVPKTYTLESFVINSGNSITSTAVLKVIKDGKAIEKVSRGDGPIDAAFKAIEKIVGMDLKLDDYQLQSVTEGMDALGDALVKISDENGEIYGGRGLSTDVIEASIQAYINAVNKMIYDKEHRA